MKVTLVTCVMILNERTGEVLVQNRKKSYPGWSFPGGHVERAESIHDCAVREVEEETGLRTADLEYRGVVHWVDPKSDDRYLCFLYKTSCFEGELLPDTEEGTPFWLSLDELLATPRERFSSPHYALSPLFHQPCPAAEVLITWNADENDWVARIQ